jgi:murein DD-endopeptidase MepM/ murein hydrolase activator NlpD
MAFGVAKRFGAAAFGLAVVTAAAASVSAPASAPAPAGDADWQGLAIGSISHGSTTGSPAAPGEAVELVPAKAEPAPAAGPVRLTGTAGADLNRAMADAGISERLAQDYLRAVSTRIRLADGISIQDRFDLVVFRGEGADELLYAGLDRVGASDVQLVRWAVDGRTQWVDATGTAAQAEAMRMPVSGGVSSRYGMRRHPILHTSRFHRGVDLKAASGTPVRASAEGRAVFAGWSGGYGRQVRIGHGKGLTTSYSHMSRIAVAPGAFVRRGQVIGYVGSSGLSTGPHLHYEVYRNGRPVNPATVRYAGGEDEIGKQERTALNARLRQLLTAGWKS